MYGLTECKRVSYLPPEELERRPFSIGKGMPNEDVYLVDEQDRPVPPGGTGELVVRGSNVMLGYWGLPDETQRVLRPGRFPGERVLYSGDLFRTDEDGFLYFIARKDDIIKCRGEKVSPLEIENVLYQLDAVQEAAVVGLPDEILGQAVVAFAVLAPDSKLTELDLIRHCSEKLENFMIPRQIFLREELPKSSNGKIDKRALSTVALNRQVGELKP
jgi:acyl-coenzyme A synthetase/AMP-(fatty) acid ligase